ncbi:Gfo/Idh/MocA family protein [Natronorubrum halophilum]|uniref:Gfo/Idh/MocA family protein n=1 Tax=Natronorubrum halophilum TaxID=1702106 RepID=UPI0010C1D738|nr:Gfo/Idh/MocA family oxidoreductase [Natronorubrum halophilum]
MSPHRDDGDAGDESIRVGIFSVAHLHANTYATQLDSLGGASFVGVADTGESRVQEFAASHGVDAYDPETLFETVDAAIVCLTNTEHRTWAERAADAGVHVLSEKPLAPGVSDARAIVDACDAADVHLGVAMPLRFSLPARKAKEALEAGEVGTLQSVAGTNRGQMPGGWFVDPAASGGGAVMDHSVHIVDLVHWLTGERVTNVYAEMDTHFHDVPVEDVNLLSMMLTDGTQFSLDGSWSRPETWDFWGDATVSLVGTDATVEVDCFGQKLKHTDSSEDGDGIASIYWGSNPNGGLVEDFVDAVREDRPPETTGEEGLEAVAVVEAAYESAERGESVDVDYR